MLIEIYKYLHASDFFMEKVDSESWFVGRGSGGGFYFYFKEQGISMLKPKQNYKLYGENIDRLLELLSLLLIKLIISLIVLWLTKIWSGLKKSWLKH